MGGKQLRLFLDGAAGPADTNGSLGAMSAGDWGTWAAAVATFAAVGVALWQAWVARHQAREAHEVAVAALELARAEALVRDEERESAAANQARLITSVAVPRGAMSLETGETICAVIAEVKNASQEPISAVQIVGAYLDRALAPSYQARLRDGDGFELALAPGDTFQVGIDYVDQHGAHLTRDQLVSPSVDVSFVDAQGVRWRRWGSVQPRLDPHRAVHREPPEAPSPLLWKAPSGRWEPFLP